MSHRGSDRRARLYGWAGTVATFLETPENVWRDALRAHRRDLIGNQSEPEQEAAWVDSHAVLRDQLTLLVGRRPQASAWPLIFEYELPREGGRRPDLIVLAGTAVVVVEFKRAAVARPEHVDQVAAYARDLESYHGGCREHPVAPLLVLTGDAEISGLVGDVRVVGRALLAKAIAHAADHAEGESVSANDWLRAEYEPLPTVVEAARAIFRDEPLPDIRRAASAGIPQTMERLRAVVHRARTHGERHLCILTGVPGSGKTLVGLQLVHVPVGSDPAERGLFLSRNGPLVRVLQHHLRSNLFVQNVTGFHRRYNAETEYLPGEHVLVYDEAQRALDAHTVAARRGGPVSEPEELIGLADRMPDWAVVVAIVGEGQEIHRGEEGGLELWDAAIRHAQHSWFVHAEAWHARLFTSAHRVFTSDRLDLSTSLRSHRAGDVHRWVNQVLARTFLEAKATAATLQAQGFTLYASHDWPRLQAYVRERYAGQPDKRYGIIGSSKAKPHTGVTFVRRPGASEAKIELQSIVRNESFEDRRAFDVVPWLTDPADSPKSCCQLLDGAREYDIQGLEVDMPILSWGSDMYWSSDGWTSQWPIQGARDSDMLRHNTYRVLMTRGRDGLLIWVPERLRHTLPALGHCGMTLLE
jgi:hypothetical protein